MTIAAILRTKGDDVIALTPQTRVGEAVAVLAEKRIGAVPVCDDGVPVGIFSERDVIRCLDEMGADSLSAPISTAMTSPPVTVDSEMSELDALALMTRRRIRHLPVVDQGRMVDFISIGDLVKARLDEIQHEAEAMREYIRTA